MAHAGWVSKQLTKITPKHVENICHIDPLRIKPAQGTTPHNPAWFCKIVKHARSVPKGRFFEFFGKIRKTTKTLKVENSESKVLSRTSKKYPKIRQTCLVCIKNDPLKNIVIPVGNLVGYGRLFSRTLSKTGPTQHFPNSALTELSPFNKKVPNSALAQLSP
jgi:hypothetical protein